MSEYTQRISVAVANDYPVVVAGVAHLLEGDPRLRVIEQAAVHDPVGPVDIVLFDAFAAGVPVTEAVESLVDDSRYGKVVVYSWIIDQPHIPEIMGSGVDAVLSKRLGADELIDAMVRIHQGETVIIPQQDSEELVMADWPGRSYGLSPREAEMIALITQGLTNDQIAQCCYLSINSVKSYIRSAYRKIGVQRRPQAVRWGLEHNMLTEAGVKRITESDQLKH